MSKKSDTNNLLLSLNRLYARLSILMYKIRSSTYNRLSSTTATSDITSELSKQVEELVEKASKSPDNENNDDKIIEDKKSYKINPHNAPGQSEVATKVTSVENELSKHLKYTQQLSNTHPGIVIKLTESIWEHIHTALRLARSGDGKKAKFHIGIVKEALDELCHYMKDEDYAELVNRVKEYLVERQI